MAEKESLAKISSDPQKKAQFLKDLHTVLTKHGVEGSAVDKLLNAGAISRMTNVESTVVVTITA